MESSLTVNYHLSSLLQLLTKLESPHNQTRIAAENLLAQLVKQPTYFEILLNAIDLATTPNHKLLCAVLFSKYCRQHPRQASKYIQQTYCKYVAFEDEKIVSCLKDALAVTICNEPTVAILCKLATIAQNEHLVIRNLELLSAILKSVAERESFFVHSRRKFDSVAGSLKEILARGTGSCLALSFKCLKNLDKMEHQLDCRTLLVWLAKALQLPNDLIKMSICKSILKMLIQAGDQANPDLGELTEVYKHLCERIKLGERLPSRLQILHVKLFRVVFSKMHWKAALHEQSKNFLPKNSSELHKCPSVLSLNCQAREFVSWLTELLHTSALNDSLMKEELELALIICWKCMDCRQVESIVSTGLAILGETQQTFCLNHENLIRRKLSTYFLLSSSYGYISHLAEYSKLLEMIFEMQLPTYTDQPELQEACLHLLNTHLSLSPMLSNAHNILHRLYRMLEHPMCDYSLLQLCCSLLRLAKYLPTEQCSGIVKRWFEVLPYFSDHSVRIECLEFAEELQHQNWESLSLLFNQQLIAKIDLELSNYTAGPIQTDVFGRLVDLLTRSINENTFNPLYLRIIAHSQTIGESSRLTEPTLRLLERVCLQVEVLCSTEIQCSLTQFPQFISDQPKLMRLWCRILLKLLTVNVYREDIVRILQTTLSDLPTITENEYPLTIVLEFLSIQQPHRVAHELVPNLLRMENENEDDNNVLPLLLTRLILRSLNTDLLIRYFPDLLCSDFQLQERLAVPDLAVLHFYLATRKKVEALHSKAKQNTVTTLMNNLSLEDSPVDRVQERIVAVEQVLVQFSSLQSAGFDVHWMLRDPLMKCEENPMIMRLAAEDPLWKEAAKWRW